MTLLKQNCTEVRFAAGTVLRRKGQHYGDMFLLLHGSAEIDPESTSGEKILVSHRGSPVGEMGFLTGRAASATVTARTDTVALVIDDATLFASGPMTPGGNVERMSASFFLTWYHDSGTDLVGLNPSEIPGRLCALRL
jgi:CRP-like cAMP-binding protein